MITLNVNVGPSKSSLFYGTQFYLGWKKMLRLNRDLLTLRQRVTDYRELTDKRTSYSTYVAVVKAVRLQSFSLRRVYNQRRWPFRPTVTIGLFKWHRHEGRFDEF